MKRWGLRLAVAAALGVAVVVVVASIDRCGGPWPARAPWVRATGHDTGPMRAGAAAVPLSIHYPTTVAGYAPWRPTAERAAAPLMARASVVEVGTQRVTLVTLDTLLVTAKMQRAVQEGQKGPVWLIATHTHTSVGGYDSRPVAEVAALGWYDERIEADLVEAARSAVTKAVAALEPARLEIGQSEVQGLTVPRSGDEVEHTLTVVRFVGARPIAQWLIFSAHPTVATPQAALLDPDWPGRLAELTSEQVSLVLQGAGGNATVDRAFAATPAEFAAHLLEHVSVPQTQLVGVELAWAEVGLALPHPEGSRLVREAEVGLALPSPESSRLVGEALLGPIESALCWGQEREAMVAMLRLGPAAFLFTTVEPSAPAGRVLEGAARADRVIGLANGYHGYLEPEEAARAAQGESKRQYFPPSFVGVLGQAASLAAASLGPSARPAPRLEMEP